uniref:Uncharacterized protein n=1 Tax=Arundo donax TaxID=35708 RepID=A0A0A8ZG53_ARUDO
MSDSLQRSNCKHYFSRILRQFSSKQARFLAFQIAQRTAA